MARLRREPADELGPNGLLILTWDEDDGTASNHILTGLVGARVIAGSTYTPLATHDAITRLISDVFGLPLIGYSVLEEPILGIWNSPVPTLSPSWGGLKTLYR